MPSGPTRIAFYIESIEVKLMASKKNKDETKSKKLIQRALEGAAAEQISRFGSAAKEHIVAYSGEDQEHGQSLKRSLKSISKSKVNSEYEQANIKQQAGFSAEVKSVARKNADNIINKNGNRFVRSDDLGRTNDQIIDIAEVDIFGHEITGHGSQMKYVGGSPEELLIKLKSQKYQKYLDANAILDVPDNYYEELIGKPGSKGIIDQKIDKLNEQIDRAEKDGKTDLASNKKAQVEDFQKIKKNLRKGGLTSEEAIEARLHPIKSTLMDAGKVAHKAGLEQAKTGAIISGSISIVRNVVDCIQGRKEPKDATLSVINDIGTGATFSYVTAFSGTLIKGTMQNASSAYIRGLSKTNLAAGLVTTTADIGKTMIRYIKGEISGAQCVEQLGERGVGQIGSAMYATIAVAAVGGSAPVAITIAAGIIGSTLGYAAAVAVYQELSTSLKEYELAKEERIRIEAECQESILLIRQYRIEMNMAVEKYLSEHMETFESGFLAMDNAIMQNDINGFLSGNAEIQKLLGHEVQFRSHKEFEDLMLSDNDFKL